MNKQYNRNRFCKAMEKGILICDGAMGTMLYTAGVFVNTCFDELNVTRPQLIADIHKQYIDAGCDIIETNTFGANAVKLARYGLADHVDQINQKAVQIATETVAGTNVLLAGAMGPLGCEIADHSRITPEDATRAFSDQAQNLSRAGVDLLLLETFVNPDELWIAIEAAARTSLPIIAQLTAAEDTDTIYGQSIEQAVSRISAHPAVTAVGLNCSLGPAGMLESLRRIRSVTDKPISIQPNAGLPREVDGRTMYMCSPEYMAEYAKRFFESGAHIIGGCCGTTPQHMQQIVKAVKSLNKAQAATPASRIKVATPDHAQAVDPVPLAQRSRLGAKLAAEEPITMIEITPPRGTDIAKTIEKVKRCAEHNIDAINIPDGPRASSRLSPMVTAFKIKEAADIEPIIHVCCRDRNIIGMQSDMLGLQAMGLHNVLLVTGDPPKLGDYPDATAVFDLDSIALTSVVSNLNRGLDIAGGPLSHPLSMTIGVGANPVASDLKREIDRFRQKAAAGAEYAITQPVFDTEMLFAFMAAVEDCHVPFIAGIWPFTSYKNAEFMANEVPGVVVPDVLLERMAVAETKEQGRRIGIQIAREMIEQTKDHLAGYAVSAPFGNVDIALSVLDKIPIEDL